MEKRSGKMRTWWAMLDTYIKKPQRDELSGQDGLESHSQRKEGVRAAKRAFS